MDVPKRLLLANCERVLAIRPGVVDAVKKLTDALGDEEKVRQLDLLVSQHRSTQMLMDKTLGAPSVVTEENLGELFRQMIHPHLEDERKRSEKSIREEKAKGKQRVATALGKLEDAQAAESAAAKELREWLAEDRTVVEALCQEVEKKLGTQRLNRKLIGGSLALLFCSPPLFGPSAWQSYISFALALPLGYWTITGNKLIGTASSKKNARATLLKIANDRGLTAKVSRFEIEWHDNRFHIGEKTITDT